ncbi:MAG: hypothetical protein ACRENT_10270 [Thermodesulfobacteriota bacterium]
MVKPWPSALRECYKARLAISQLGAEHGYYAQVNPVHDRNKYALRLCSGRTVFNEGVR